tara:strand:+ start:21867 stop:22292 length:426 start_codon:yes stop_codon:yes gene_type:complete
MKTNDRVLKLVGDRLKLGQKKYGQDIPLNGEGGRDNFKESTEEMLDLVVYLAAVLLEQYDKEKKDRVSNKKTVQPEELAIIFKGMSMLSSKAFEENQIQYGHKVNDLMKSMKENCNWNEEDEQNLQRTGEFTKCIPGSNCD